MFCSVFWCFWSLCKQGFSATPQLRLSEIGHAKLKRSMPTVKTNRYVNRETSLGRLEGMKARFDIESVVWKGCLPCLKIAEFYHQRRVKLFSGWMEHKKPKFVLFQHQFTDGKRKARKTA